MLFSNEIESGFRWEGDGRAGEEKLEGFRWEGDGRAGRRGGRENCNF